MDWFMLFADYYVIFVFIVGYIGGVIGGVLSGIGFQIFQKRQAKKKMQNLIVEKKE